MSVEQNITPVSCLHKSEYRFHLPHELQQRLSLKFNVDPTLELSFIVFVFLYLYFICSEKSMMARYAPSTPEWAGTLGAQPHSAGWLCGATGNDHGACIGAPEWRTNLSSPLQSHKLLSTNTDCNVVNMFLELYTDRAGTVFSRGTGRFLVKGLPARILSLH